MSNIFRSKEIYKRIPGVSSDNNPLRAVQGMYVSGEYRPPYYIDGFVQVSNIKTKKATIKNYTQAEKSLRNDPVINVTDISAKKNVDVVYYTRATVSAPKEPVINVTDISANMAEIIYFTQDTKPSTDPVINVTDISAKKNVDIVNYKITCINTNPDHSVRVSKISTTKATITSTDSTSGT